MYLLKYCIFPCNKKILINTIIRYVQITEDKKKRKIQQDLKYISHIYFKLKSSADIILKH